MRKWFEKMMSAPDEGAAGADAATSADTGVQPAEETTTAEATADVEGSTPAPQVIPLEVFNKRISTLSAQKAALAEQLQATRAALELAGATKDVADPQPEGSKPATLPPPGKKFYTEEEVMALSAQQASLREFNAKCNAVAAQGQKAFTDFDATIGMLNNAVGVTPDFLEGVLALDNPAEVLYNLGKDLSKAGEIINLSPHQRAVALVRYAAGLASPTAPKISKAPAPPSGKLAGNDARVTKTVDSPDISIADWIALRDKEAREKRR